VAFTFLGYTFRPRKAVDKYGRVYVNFAPAVSRDALKAMRQTVRGWHLQLKCDKSLADLSAMFNPILRSWHQYYGRFYESAMSAVWNHLNDYLTRWLMRKYKRLARHKTRATPASRVGAYQFDRRLYLETGQKKPREVNSSHCVPFKIRSVLFIPFSVATPSRVSGIVTSLLNWTG
jgi:RNA-directed DNA polymerase